MDIAALSIIKNQAQLQQDVGVSVLKKALNTAEQNSNLLTKMMDNSENTIPQEAFGYLGNNIDDYA
ncbi:YjfB family protein [Desulfotomaculum sp. 1211_IL3151]|uniref:YjfB family protein n=1 Tax=Desulfotomaculum sp. 1211_IL3151 TaxID=3084055 RepID=UPI002FD99E21